MQYTSAQNKPFQTPVLFLIFNRVGLTQKVFNEIKKIKPKYLYVAADGPRPDNSSDVETCRETRNIIEQIDWDCELKTLFRDKNLGCGPAVSSAISWFFEHVEAGMILEDDCVPNLSFFPFCEELLEKYKDSDVVKFIGGNNFQGGRKRGNASYYFSHYPASWGWATWRRSWQIFRANISESTAEIKSGKLDYVFNSTKEKNHWIKSLYKANRESSSVWDFHFYYSIWKSGGLCITPNQNLVVNMGFFDQATHYFLKDSTKTSVKNETMVFPLVHPDKVEVNREADKYTFNHFYSHSGQRAIRLLRENNIYGILAYLKNRFL
ncbi:nucleotide-diphospho-sugar transferase [Mucilaginibacter robiniae]|uniref:Nucleotide-diphospho-sugar transferase n=1 Tax=Mucilaginibacter robiniae TaxID=2728022 RepID=A0A7L5DTH3_9SPHI|nr:nucleotide-diphospho-sugar transferase [Mucilaginibacter robiniae]QJD94405.1 nucleotide-diphospho-sugar transferase [Mucilaginibacter robiniae]